MEKYTKMKENSKENQMSASSGDCQQKVSIWKNVKDGERRENKMARNGKGREEQVRHTWGYTNERTHTHTYTHTINKACEI